MTKRTVKRELTDSDVYTRDVVAPGVLAISSHCQNSADLALWFRLLSLYVESMNAVGRAVLLKHDEDHTIYVSSIEVER